MKNGNYIYFPNFSSQETSKQFQNKNSLIKISIDEKDKSTNINENDIESINKIEKKYDNRQKFDFFKRENQVSISIEEVIIGVPKKKMRDERLILSDDKMKKHIQKKKIEEENKEDKEKRKIEKEKDEEKIKELLKINEINRIKVKKNTIVLFFKYMLFLLIVTGIIIYFII